jgi:hypothetical protein
MTGERIRSDLRLRCLNLREVIGTHVGYTASEMDNLAKAEH